MKKNKIEYPVKGFRISEQTHKLLKTIKDKNLLTWNKLFLLLIKKYEHPSNKLKKKDENVEDTPK